MTVGTAMVLGAVSMFVFQMVVKDLKRIETRAKRHAR